LRASIPGDVVAVAESGLHSAGDLRRLKAAGYDAFLVGERLVCARHPGAALAELLPFDSEAVPTPKGPARSAECHPK
jgi:indole-3-glycerol phosphate synthase